jgi:hypothetical protein
MPKSRGFRCVILIKKFFVLALFAVVVSSASVSQAQENCSPNEFFSEHAIQLAYEHPGNKSGFKQAYFAVVVNCDEWITLISVRSVYRVDLAHIKLGAEVMIYDALPENGFLPSKYNGILGWVLKDYIKIVGAA